MDSSLASWVVLCGTATGLVLALALIRRGRERAIARRVDLIKGWPTRHGRYPEPAGPPSLPIRALFTFRMRRTWGLTSSSPFLLLVGLCAAAAVGLLCRYGLHQQWYSSAIAAVAAFFLLPRFLLMREQRRSDAQFAELLPDAIDMVIRILRVGLPISAAIRTVAQEAKAPVSGVFAAIADQTEIGVPLNDALARTGEAVGNPDLRFFTVAVALQQTTGGNLAAPLETLSQILRKRRAVRLQARAASAEVRMSAIVLAGMPFLVAAGLLVFSPSYLRPLFVDVRGNYILGMALICLLLAGLTMRGMIRNSLTV